MYFFRHVDFFILFGASRINIAGRGIFAIQL